MRLLLLPFAVLAALLTLAAPASAHHGDDFADGTAIVTYTDGQWLLTARHATVEFTTNYPEATCTAEADATVTCTTPVTADDAARYPGYDPAAELDIIERSANTDLAEVASGLSRSYNSSGALQWLVFGLGVALVTVLLASAARR